MGPLWLSIRQPIPTVQAQNPVMQRAQFLVLEPAHDPQTQSGSNLIERWYSVNP
jgi:hypothetical protein